MVPRCRRITERLTFQVFHNTIEPNQNHTANVQTFGVSEVDQGLSRFVILIIIRILIVICSMQKGTIARLTQNGFGFIAREGEEKDLFFHASDLKGVEYNDLKEGETVTFELGQGDRGPKAINVARA